MCISSRPKTSRADAERHAGSRCCCNARAHGSSRRSAPGSSPARQAIKFKDAKLEKITFELARLKRWKFGAKTEAMTAEQRAVRGDAGRGRGEPAGAARRACRRKTDAELPRRAPSAARRAARRCPSTCAASSTTTSPRTRLPDARLRPADGAHRRGHQRAAGHRAGRVLRAPPHPRQVGLQVLPECWCRSRSIRRSSTAASRPRAGGAHADQPLRRPPAVLPAGDDQRALGRAHAALDAGGLVRRTPARRWSRCTRRTRLRAELPPCCMPTRRRCAMLDPGAGKTKRAYIWAYARGEFDAQPRCRLRVLPRARREVPGGLPQGLARHAGLRRVQGLRHRAQDAAERIEAGCAAHARRKFDELVKTAPARWPTRRSGASAWIYRVEKRVAD